MAGFRAGAANTVLIVRASELITTSLERPGPMKLKAEFAGPER